MGRWPGNTGRAVWACEKHTIPMSKQIPTVMKDKRAICWLWSESSLYPANLGVLRFYYFLTKERPASRNLPKIKRLIS